MGNPFARFGVSDSQLQKYIAESAGVDAAVNAFMENEVVPYWKSISRVHSGAYAASVKVVKKSKGGRGVVAATVFYAHMLEYGTGVDKKGKDKRPILVDGAGAAVGDGGWATVPKNTPTKPLGIAQKVASHFGGNLKSAGGKGIDLAGGE